MSFFSSYNNADAAVIKLLKWLSITIDPEKIVSELAMHPDYPSLLAISDVLHNFNIKNSAFKISASEIKDMPVPFLVHTKLNSGNFFVVTKIENDRIIFSDEKSENNKINFQDFETIFTGVVLSTEPPIKLSAEHAFPTDLKRFRLPFAVIGSLLIFFAALIFHTNYFVNFNWQRLLLTLFTTAGLITSVLLLVQSIDNDNPLVLKLCQAGGNTNCKNILSSKAAKLFKWLSWSEVGFFYFAGTWLALLFGNHSVSLLQLLAILNIISLPYTFYSIYYQARIAKQWCILCCTIQALLWLEFVPFVATFGSAFTSPGRVEWSTLFITFLLPVVLWILIKPLFLKAQQITPLKNQLRTFKYNSDLFNKMLTDQPKYAQPEKEWAIVLGNEDASHIITMVSNPYCPPCAKTHKLLDELLDQRGDIQARIIFSVDNTDQDIRTPVSRLLMALNELADKAIVKHALNDWYEQNKDYETWAKVYPVEINEMNFAKLDNQKDWCKMAEVVATPTLLLDGHKLPGGYLLSDLKYMLQ